jgi:drug/metabolite transporter (DMT)-like permease
MRSITEALGQLGGAATVYAVAGGLGLARLALSRERRRRVHRLPAKYLLGCGALVACYVLAVFMTFGRARDRQQALEVGLVHYLWPALTVLFSVALLRTRARPWLLPATLLCLLGIYLGLRPAEGGGLAAFAANLASNPSAYAFALLAATSWALYSALARRWARAEEGGGADFFLASTGLLLAIAQSLFGSPAPAPSPRAMAEAAFLGVATYASYGLWDQAMRRGNMLLVTICSYFTPLLSLAVGSAYLKVAPPPLFWAGCGLVVLGSLLSWGAVRTVPPPAPRQGASCSGA